MLVQQAQLLRFRRRFEDDAAPIRDSMLGPEPRDGLHRLLAERRREVMWSSARCARPASTSMSRTIIGPRVIIAAGFEKSRKTSRHRLVRRYLPSAGW